MYFKYIYDGGISMEKDFLTQISDKLTEMGNEVSQKAKDTANIISLKNKIRAEEEKEKLIYQTIGEKYFEAHKNEENDPYAEDIAAVFAAKAGIDTLKSQIREIKGLDKCTECGAEIVGDAVFCPKCGKKL